MEEENNQIERPTPEGANPMEEEHNAKKSVKQSEDEIQQEMMEEISAEGTKEAEAEEGEAERMELPNDSLKQVAEKKVNKTRANIEVKNGQGGGDKGPDSEKGAANVINTSHVPMTEPADDDGTSGDDDELLFMDKPDLQARNKLYNKGLRLFNQEKTSKALPYFLSCITGVLETGEFQYFPHCLKKISEIYYSQEDYEKAVEFIQAEKLFYETALLNRSDLDHTRPAEGTVDESDTKTNTQTDGDPEDIRADEYEKLAQMCLEKKQPELALEYQGKATQIRQQNLGNDHPLTKKSLDLFTVVYAEVGKQEYSDTLKKTIIQQPDDGKTGVRKRKGVEKDPNQEDGPQEQQEQESTPNTHEIRVLRILLVDLFMTCIFLLIFLLTYLYCRRAMSSSHCSFWRSQLHFYYMKFKFLYYTWNPSPHSKFG